MKRHSLNSQHGAVIPMVAVTLVMLLSFGALAVDLAYAYVARNEAQNAADAAALNGARFLFPLDAATKEPNWSLAEAEAAKAIALNKITNASLSTGDVISGYWDITSAVHDVHPTQAGVNDLPAVKVTIDKQSNGGPISTFFARVFGVDTINVGATAVAVVASPNTTKESLFPVAINQCMFDLFYNPDGTLKPIQDGSDTFKIGSDVHYDGCEAGQWTSLTTGDNNVPIVKEFIDFATGKAIDTTPTEIGVGTDIWIEPGTKATLYDIVDACSSASYGSPGGDGSCEFVLVSVVCPNPDPAGNCGVDLEDKNHSYTPVSGFACLQILCAVGGKDKGCSLPETDPKEFFIKGRMVPMDAANIHPNCKISGTGGSAPNNGIVLPPKLANYFGNTY